MTREDRSDAETSNTFGQRLTGHPQTMRLFWHSFGSAAEILMDDGRLAHPIRGPRLNAVAPAHYPEASMAEMTPCHP